MTRAVASPRPAAKPASVCPREAAARDACAWRGDERPPELRAMLSIIALALAAWALVGLAAVAAYWVATL